MASFCLIKVVGSLSSVGSLTDNSSCCLNSLYTFNPALPHAENFTEYEASMNFGFGSLYIILFSASGCFIAQI